LKFLVARESTASGRNRVMDERTEAFRADSATRPWIAENLARGRPWYSGFAMLMTKRNPATDRPYRDQLTYPEERKGLHAMISDAAMWDSESERLVVQAVHEALGRRYARIADDHPNDLAARRNRFGAEYNRWRLAFAGAKTPQQFRQALCDLFSRAGRNAVLQKQWPEVLAQLRSENWRHARDLALLALCSYLGRGAAGTADQEPPSP
jgi:CRISPR-associated protein Cas8a1/Csx13